MMPWMRSLDRHLGAGLDEHARAFHRLGVRADEELGVDGDAAVAQRLEQHVERHQLRHRGRRHRLRRRPCRTSPCRCRRRSPVPRAPWSRRPRPGAARPSRAAAQRAAARDFERMPELPDGPPRGRPVTGIVEPAAQVKIYLWLYQAAARGATRLCGPAPARRRCRGRRRPRWTGGSRGRPAGGEERDDRPWRRSSMLTTSAALGPRQAGDRGPEPGGALGRRRAPPGPRARRRPGSAWSSKRSAQPLARPARRRRSRPQAASGHERQPSDAAPAAALRHATVRLPPVPAI